MLPASHSLHYRVHTRVAVTLFIAFACVLLLCLFSLPRGGAGADRRASTGTSYALFL